MVVENNYGYAGPHHPPRADPAPRAPAGGRERERARLPRVWTQPRTAPSVVPKLSLRNGLVYTYTKEPDTRTPDDPFYLTALDFRTGPGRCSSAWPGSGFGFNNNYAPVPWAQRHRLRGRAGWAGGAARQGPPRRWCAARRVRGRGCGWRWRGYGACTAAGRGARAGRCGAHPGCRRGAGGAGALPFPGPPATGRAGALHLPALGQGAGSGAEDQGLGAPVRRAAAAAGGDGAALSVGVVRARTAAG